MEIQGGLSEELKLKIAETKVAIIGKEAVDLINSQRCKLDRVFSLMCQFRDHIIKRLSEATELY